MSITTEGALRERVLVALGDIDLKGFAEVEAARGTPLFESAQAVLPGARAVAVLGMEVFAEIAALITPDKVVGEAAARELYAPHVDYLNGRLNRGLYELAKVLRVAGYKAVPLPSVGTPVDGRYQRALLSFKHAAERAGLGRIGRSSLLITEEFGPRVRLACLVTDAPLGSTARELPDPCFGCAGDCIASCPAEALAWPVVDEPYKMNRYACCAFRAGSGMCSTCLAKCSRA